MQHAIYLKLALQSLKKNYRISVPFIGGSIIMTAMLYAIISLTYNPGLGESFGGSYIQMMMDFGYRIVLIFVLIFMFYLNSVWLKNRNQENGLLSVLGLNKSHLIRIQFYQLATILIASLMIGFPLGICLDKLIYLFVLKVANLSPQYGFYLSGQGASITATWMSLCFGALLIWSTYSIVRSNPLEKLQHAKAGEQAIKNRWVFALAGLICLGIGYGMAVTITDPLSALLYFFVAVFFVVIGTYLLFGYGTTALVSLLQKNKRFYYSPAHFISIATLKYRLKQNAAALANIAILSTMILVTLSTTLSLVLTIQESTKIMYPMQYTLNAFLADSWAEPAPEPVAEQTVIDEVNAAINASGLQMTDSMAYALERQVYNTADGQQLPIYLVELDDVNRICNTNLQAGPNQMILLSGDIKDQENPGPLTLEDGQTTLEIVDTLDDVPENLQSLTKYGSYGAIVAATHLDQLPPARKTLTMMFDTNSPENHHDQIYEALMSNGSNTHITDFSNAEVTTQEVFGMYSGMLFIGVYLSLLFILTVILILYYKQISEGLDDKDRFAIMKKVGLEPSQVKKVINDQVLLMFFMPLGISLVHILFAFPMLTRILQGMNMSDAKLFLTVMLACFAVFALIYLVIYRMTSRTYYKLVCFDE